MKKLIALLSIFGIGYHIGKGVAERENNGKKPNETKQKLDRYDALNKKLESK